MFSSHANRKLLHTLTRCSINGWLVCHIFVSNNSSPATTVPLFSLSLYPNVNKASSAHSAVGITWLFVKRTSKLFEKQPMNPVPPLRLPFGVL